MIALPMKSILKSLFMYLKYPSIRVAQMPDKRPSKKSIYYLINQLGRHKPIGLTHNIGVAYHELPFEELIFPTSRQGLKQRIEKLITTPGINRGAYGLDLGCAIGGITFGLQKIGCKMTELIETTVTKCCSQCEISLQAHKY